jgi:(1->4)-alpha-D-glucan 1-alpha-D-glucosylmutase
MIATYRLQLTPTFGFEAVRELLPYFERLGISHLYLSPLTEARPGSRHGYDVIDHNSIRAEYGGREGFDRLREAAVEAGLAIILDFVPNHAGVGPNNAYWQDILAYGPHSPYDTFFDIDWEPLKESLQGMVLLPFLGRAYGDALDDGEIGVDYADGRFYATYYDHRFALNPASYVYVLDALLDRFERQDAYFDLKDLREAYASLHPGARQKAETLQRRLVTLDEQLHFSDALPDLAPEALHALLETQYWRLAYWKTAGYEVNYRRFFDINGLVALCMENEDVFWDAHQLLGELLAQEGIAGVRIDHIDGLFDPHDYLNHLQDLGAQQIWVEKILAAEETLPGAWPVEGTTGYEFMNDVMDVLLQPEGEAPLTRIYHRFVTDALSYEGVVRQSKSLVMGTSLSSELYRLAYGLNRISEADYHTRDFTLTVLREALAELIAAFDRYRTYLPHDEDEARTVLQEAVDTARHRNPAFDPSVFDFIMNVTLGRVRDDLRAEQQAWTGRFQQYTAPVTAKGIEDTAFYRYLRFVALNEVGGEPDRFGQPPEAFHDRARLRAQQYPHNLLPTSTHDHKRGADVRMRLLALAEVPDQWQEALRTLSRIAQSHRSQTAPSQADEYLFFQILAALWHDADRDALPDRLWTYMQKASRESKQHTSWINPDADYEAALEALVRDVLTDHRLPDALDDLSATLATYGFANTLSQTVLQCTTPGVPDLYQGTEVLDLSLVDPDNRRPVDFAHRKELLDTLAPMLDAPKVHTLRTWIDEQDERAKYYLLVRLLRLRRAHSALFEQGDYRGLPVASSDMPRHIAFSRSHGATTLAVVVPRFPASRAEPSEATITLPESTPTRPWSEVLSGQTLSMKEVLQVDALPLPWAVLLHRSEDE